MSRSPWTDEELVAAVDAYLNLLQREANGEPYNKAEVNQSLREGALSQRTKGSIEYRMQNISAVLQDAGEAWLAGYKPAAHVGAGVAKRIRHFLERLRSP